MDRKVKMLLSCHLRFTIITKSYILSWSYVGLKLKMTLCYQPLNGNIILLVKRIHFILILTVNLCKKCNQFLKDIIV